LTQISVNGTNDGLQVDWSGNSSRANTYALNGAAIGGVGGGVVGGVGGAIAGSSVPVAGTAAGGVAGFETGATIGAAGGGLLGGVIGYAVDESYSGTLTGQWQISCDENGKVIVKQTVSIQKIRDAWYDSSTIFVHNGKDKFQ
jgi:MFS family permease